MGRYILWEGWGTGSAQALPVSHEPPPHTCSGPLPMLKKRVLRFAVPEGDRGHDALGPKREWTATWQPGHYSLEPRPVLWVCVSRAGHQIGQAEGEGGGEDARRPDSMAGS